MMLLFLIQRDIRIHTLDVSGNDIGAMGIMYLAEMMMENNTIYELVSTTNYDN